MRGAAASAGRRRRQQRGRRHLGRARRYSPFQRGSDHGPRRLGRYLTDEQNQVLESLPPLEATWDSIIEGYIALARVFLPRARRLAERTGRGLSGWVRGGHGRLLRADARRRRGCQALWRLCTNRASSGCSAPRTPVGIRGPVGQGSPENRSLGQPSRFLFRGCRRRDCDARSGGPAQAARRP